MDAVPPSPPVQGDHQHVGARQPLEEVGGSGGGQRRVAQGSGHAVEHRTAGEEGDQPRRQPGEDDDLEVVVQEAVIACQRDLGATAVTGRSRGQGRELERHRPALGPSDQLGNVARVAVESRVRQERVRLVLVHGEVFGTDLQHPALGAQPRQRQGWLASAGDSQLRPGREVVDQPGHDFQAVPTLEQVEVVEHEDDRQRGPRHRGPELWEDGVDGGAAREPQGLQQRRVEWLDLVEGGGDAPQEDRWVIVVMVDGEPGERPGVAFGPRCQERRLPVPGRGQDRDHRRGAGGLQEVEQGGPGDRGMCSEVRAQSRLRPAWLPGDRVRHCTPVPSPDR